MTRRRRRVVRVLVAFVLVVVGALVVGGGYLRSLPWKNRCGAEPVAGALPTSSAVANANAAVATSQPIATKAAADVLKDGGNAVDAAIAAAITLAVVEPANSGLGGGGFALVHDPRAEVDAAHSDVLLDFRERAPLGLDVAALSTRAQIDASVLRNGPLAVAVPSEWGGLVELHKRWGTMPMSRLARDAIAVARGGFVVGRDYSARCWVRSSVLRADPDAKRIFMGGSSFCPLSGWTLKEPELADTLAALTRDDDPKSFDDVVGKKMVQHLALLGSAITDRDLVASVPVERPVVTGTFHGRKIVSAGPPSSGGSIVIGVLQSYEAMRTRLPQAPWLRLWIEASRMAYYDRATLFGDPDVVTVPTAKLTSLEYAHAQSDRVFAAGDNGRVDLPLELPSPRESTHTTHVSVVDDNGMAVSLTQTINVPFGSGIVVPGTGVLLNDEMDDFALDGKENAFGLVGNALNAPAPGKRPLSSMSPTFVYAPSANGMGAGAAAPPIAIVLGSPGGSSIPTAVAWVIRAVVEDGVDGDTAVRAPRVHHQWWPDVLEVEPRFDKSLLAQLPSSSAPKTKRPLFPVGRVQMVLRDKSGAWVGVSDCRDDGVAWSGAL